MLEVKNAIVDALEPIEVELTDGGGDVAKDDVSQYVLTAGQAFPIVKISKTIIKNTDIKTFTMKCGLQNPLPIASFIVNDASNQFRETDYIDATTPIRIWLGNPQLEQSPINYLMKVVDVQLKSGTIIAKTELSLPTEPINVYNDTVEAMLQSFASQTGLGIRCNFDNILSLTVIRNFVNITPIDFIRQFTEHIGVDWFIDAEYNLCLLDIELSISQHQDKTCEYNFFTTYQPEQPYKVAYTNNLDEQTIFRFTTFGYDFIDVDNTVPEVEAVEFDKAFSPDIAKSQTIEEDFVDKPIKPDTDCLYFEAEFDPFKLVGETMSIQVYTQMNRPKRMTLDERYAGDKLDMSQLLIEDISGIYMLTDVTYIYNGQSFDAWTAFQRPTKQDA